MLIADTTPGVDHGEREVLQQRRILQSVVHDDKARTLCARECCTGDTVPRHDNRGRLRDVNRFVTNLCGNFAVSIDALWTYSDPAIPAGEAKRTRAGVCEHFASIITVGVLPAPPSVKLPTHTTGRPAETPFVAMRRAAMAP